MYTMQESHPHRELFHIQLACVAFFFEPGTWELLRVGHTGVELEDADKVEGEGTKLCLLRAERGLHGPAPIPACRAPAAALCARGRVRAWARALGLGLRRDTLFIYLSLQSHLSPHTHTDTARSRRARG